MLGPIIGVTGNAMEKDKINFIASGCSDVLTKPLELDLLYKALKG